MTLRLTRPVYDSPELSTPWDRDDLEERRERDEEARLERFEQREDEQDSGAYRPNRYRPPCVGR